MTTPRDHPDEAHRLEALRLYDVLRLQSDKGLDDVTVLAAQICDAPISLISFVDAERVWFSSKHGLALDDMERDGSFCSAAILDADLFVIPDSLADDRFTKTSLVAGATRVRFYAGAPLVMPSGYAIGSLCVMDHRPRELTNEERDALLVLSRQVVTHLELRRQTRDLAEHEAQLLMLFQNSPAALSIARWDDRTFVDANPAFTEVFGWTHDEIVGRSAVDLNFVNAGATADLRARLGDLHALRDQELTVRARSGAERLVLIGSELLELHGEPHVITTYVDITERKRGEMIASRLAAIVESSDDAIIGKDLQGMVTSWNRGAERIFGYSAPEMVGTSIMRVIPPERAQEEVDILTRVAQGFGVSHLETVRQTKDGRMIDVSITTSPIRDAAGTIVGASKIARDITDRRRSDEERRELEARYRALFDHAPDGLLIARQNGVYLDANPSICEMLGYTREELIGRQASDIVAPAELGYISPALSTITSNADYRSEWRFKRKDDSIFTADVIGAMMPDGTVLGMIRDSTERNRSESRLRRLVESNAQGVMFWDANGVVTGANDAFLSIVSRSRGELEAGQINVAAMTPPDYDEVDRRARSQIATNGVCTPYEKELVRPDGTRVPVLIGAAAFADTPDEGVSFVLDLTHRKQLEQQVLRAQRMESVGTLAGGIAHDLNNVLAPILLSVALLRADIDDPPLAELLETVETCAKRGADLVQQVLSFARGVEGRQVLVNPHHLMHDLVRVMRDTFPRSIDIAFEAPPLLWTVVGDPTQMHQVFLNLGVNGRDAMPGGGRLSVSMENAVLDETYAAMNIDSRAGAYVVVTVADTGPGIPLEIRERIFEPFFTTKGVGQGTGLGLSTSLAIVKSHGGFIHVYSEPGQGTTFKVYFPANTTARVVEAIAVDRNHLPRGDDELILVVDDESAVRNIAQATLQRFGYRVLLAANGAEAVALFAVHRGEIAAVLTDMAMPVMGGPATIIALKAIDPTVKI
ncbi:MAG TPA: PAS domain S-box protein, partial [Gemmatimonadaceae bacterium]|nr:PAS domain S-box protein [Gemmatimonadaceae bacterium]